MHIALNGWNGQYNVGDDAMTSVIVRKMQQGDPKAIFSILADPADMADYGINVPIRGTSGIKFWRRVPVLRGLMMDKWFAPAFVKGADVLLYGGGSIFQHAPVMQRQLRLLGQAKQQNPKVKIGALGVSVGPFKDDTDKAMAQKLLSNMAFVCLRDESSVSEFEALGLDVSHIVAPDMALLLPKLSGMSMEKPRIATKYVGVSLRHSRTDDEVYAHMANMLTQLMVADDAIKVRMFQFCALPHENDLALSSALLKHVPTDLHPRFEDFEYSKQPLDFYSGINECRLMLCVRLHAAVLSYAMRTPFVVYPYHAKCTAFARMVKSPDKYLANAVHLPLLAEMIEVGAPDQFEAYEAAVAAAERHFQLI